MIDWSKATSNLSSPLTGFNFLVQSATVRELRDSLRKRVACEEREIEYTLDTHPVTVRYVSKAYFHLRCALIVYSVFVF